MTNDTLAKLVRQGMSLEQINADQRTVRPIDRRELVGKILTMGLLPIMQRLASSESPLQAAAVQALALIQSDLVVIRTNQPEEAFAFGKAVSAMVDSGHITADQESRIYELGGGLIVDEQITEERFAEVEALIARQDRAAQLRRAAQAKHDDDIALIDSWVRDGGEEPSI